METGFRLFRSRVFWLGVPGLVFLLWLWVDSVKTRTICWGGKHPWVHLAQEDSFLQLQFTRSAATRGVSSWSWGGDRKPRATVNSWPRLMYGPQWRHHDDPGGWKGSMHTLPAVMDIFILPHWFVVLLYVLPWTGVVAWRWWKCRVSTPLPAIP